MRVAYPIALHFEFRTRERKTQVIALEFDEASKLVLFQVESAQTIVRMDTEQYLLSYPLLSDGQWHAVDLQIGIETFAFTIDSLYTKVWLDFSIFEHSKTYIYVYC